MIEGPAFRYHGGKYRLAPWVLQHFPPHRTYVEPYGGAAGVMLQKERAYSEVYNDLDGDVVNFFRVCQCPIGRMQLVEVLEATPNAREEIERACEPTDHPVERARRMVIRAQMGFGSAGATKGRTGFRIDSQREYGTAQHLWARYPGTIGPVGDRFTGVLIEDRPALEVMLAHDTPDTLHYVDPPYMHEARKPGGGGHRYYRHELEHDDHVALLGVLAQLQGMVVLSGYPTELYDRTLAEWGWTRTSTTARISAGRGGAIRNEVLWCNPACKTPPSRQSVMDFAGKEESPVRANSFREYWK